MDWRPVCNHLAMSDDYFESFSARQSERGKALIAYAEFVRSKLVKYQDTFTSKLHTCHKEYNADFPTLIS